MFSRVDLRGDHRAKDGRQALEVGERRRHLPLAHVRLLQRELCARRLDRIPLPPTDEPQAQARVLREVFAPAALQEEGDRHHEVRHGRVAAHA